MNRLSCFVRRMESMSLGRRRGCWRACTKWLAWPFGVSHIKASYGMAAPSKSSRGAQVHWGRHTSASSLLSTELPLLSLGSLVIFYCLFFFRGTNSPSFNSWSGFLFFRLGIANRPRSVGGGGGGITRGCVLGVSFELPPLFQLASRPFRPGCFFWSIYSSSSSDFESTRVMINCWGWIEDRLIDSVSESEISTGFLDGPTSSPKRNWSISSSKDSREDAISSFAITSASKGTYCKGIMSRGGICWTGSLTGGRSSQAKKSSLDTLIWFIRGSPALMVWPISWKTLEMGSKSKIK